MAPENSSASNNSANLPERNLILQQSESWSSIWEQFLHRHELAGVWDFSEETEAERYGEIIAHLTKACEEQREAERKLIQEKERWTVELRHHGENLDRHGPTISYIIHTATAVEKTWATARSCSYNEELRLRNSKAHKNTYSTNIRTIWIGSDLFDSERRQLHIAQTLKDSVYYLGHQGGDYIFKHQPPRPIYSIGTPSDSVVPIHPAKKAWTTFQEAFAWQIANCEDISSDFIYCGQVPRPTQEYICRINRLVPHIVKIVCSAIGFHASTTYGPLPNILQKFCIRSGESSRKVINDLWLWWTRGTCISHHIAAEFQEMARNNGKILEFVGLIQNLTDHGEGCSHLLAQIKPLETLLEAITGLCFMSLLRLDTSRNERMARALLFRKKEFTNVMVFADEITDDVHAHYKQPEYLDDVRHPCKRYYSVNIDDALIASERLHEADWRPESNLRFRQKRNRRGTNTRLKSTSSLEVPDSDRCGSRDRESSLRKASATKAPVLPRKKRGRPPKVFNQNQQPSVTTR